MPYFSVIGIDHPQGLALRDSVRQQHRRYVADNQAPITFVGPFLNDAGEQCGSFYIFELEDQAAVEQWLEQEPFVQAGVYTSLTIHRFQLGKNQLPLRNLAAPKD